MRKEKKKCRNLECYESYRADRKRCPLCHTENEENNNNTEY